MAAPKIHIVREEPTSHPGTTTATAIERYQHGWRSGKPVEDPDKLKRWGFVGAKPSEYLVVTRGGHIDRKRSGQGARVFKWPWHSIAIVPTTLQRIEFTADQVTRERVGVAVTGIAVYRIAEPLLAFRVLNFTFPEAAAEKLAETLREMFVGSARRLIANLSLDDCLTRRKETIAGFLMDEIAPVVGGEGSPADTTTKGWGVVIDTIEIQQVKIQSPHVFAHLQAPYRAEIAARAEQAQLEHQRATRALKARTEAEATEVEAREAARRAEMKAAADVAAMAAERTRAEAAQRAAVLELEHERALEQAKQEAAQERDRKQAELALELRRSDAEMRDHEHQLEATHQRRLAEIEQLLAQQRTLRDLVTHGLPEIARALQHSFGTVHYTQIGGDAASGPLSAVPAALGQLLAIARSFGLELPEREP
ncbi:MAG: SPFH domain-containing protein [Acidobacteriota bacterium]